MVFYKYKIITGFMVRYNPSSNRIRFKEPEPFGY